MTIDPPSRQTSSADYRPQPLSGIRVLDLGHVYQAPYATFLMVMAGAEIIKIEPPQGDISRKSTPQENYPFQALNAGKKGVVLDLKTTSGRQSFLRLVESSDVLVENFTSGVMDRLNLGPETLLSINPRLIYASSSGFGKSGPYSDRPAFDLTIQAMSGLLSLTGELSGPPLRAGGPVADFIAGAHLFGAVTTALFERERTGMGRVLEVSMLEALVPTILPAAALALEGEAQPVRRGNRHVSDSYVPFDTYQAKDGWVAIVCGTEQQWKNLTIAMQRQDLNASSELSSLQGRVKHIDLVNEAISKWTLGTDRESIVSLCDKYRVPAAPVKDVHEVLNDPHLKARNFFRSELRPDGRIQYFPGSPIRFVGTPQVVPSPAPELGEHMDDLDAEMSPFREV